MPFVPTEAIEHTLIHNGGRRTGRAETLTLRIMRFDAYVYDWDADSFKALDDGTLGTTKKPATERDATDDPGAYYWLVGAGPSVTGVLSEAFALPGGYRFELDDEGLGYHHAWGVQIRQKRVIDQFSAQMLGNDKYLSDGAQGNYQVKEDDGEEDLIVKTVRSKGGGSILIPDGTPAQEITAE